MSPSFEATLAVTSFAQYLLVVNEACACQVTETQQMRLIMDPANFKVFTDLFGASNASEQTAILEASETLLTSHVGSTYDKTFLC